MDNDHKWASSQDTQMSRKHLKICSTSLKVSMQIKTEYFHLSVDKNQSFIRQHISKNVSVLSQNVP